MNPETDATKKIMAVLMAVATALIIVWAVLHTVGCEEPTDGCTKDETACSGEEFDPDYPGSVVWICNEDQIWQRVTDCSDYRAWVCCEVDGEAECYEGGCP